MAERRGKVAAGTLLYRRAPSGDLEVLIVRPTGPAARWGWSIPKGLPEPTETLEAAARRETLEETGVEAGALTPLGHIDYVKTHKRIHAFFGAAPADAAPRKASWEISDARFVALAEARQLLHPDQRRFIDLLQVQLQA